MRRNNKVNPRLSKLVARQKYAERQIDKFVKWSFNIKGYVKLKDIIKIDEKLPFASINRKNGFREVTVSGDLFPLLMNTSQARQFLMESGLPEIAKKYNINCYG